MESPLQQRVVGAIVLVTLGVIFIPALLDGAGYKSRQVQDIEVKDKPEFPPLSQKKLAPIATPTEIRNSEKLTASKPTKKVIAEKKPIRSFALQVGTFGSNQNAEKLRNKMRKAGHSAYVQKQTTKDKTSYKVRIGPEVERSVLDKLKKSLLKSHKIDGYVVNHP